MRLPREGDNSVHIIKLRIKQRVGYNIIEQLFCRSAKNIHIRSVGGCMSIINHPILRLRYHEKRRWTMIRVLPPPYIFTSAKKSLFRFSRISFFLNGRLNWFWLFVTSFHLVIRFWHLCQRFLWYRFGFFCLHWWFTCHFLWHALWTGQFRLNFRYFAAFCRLAGTTLERFIAGGWRVFAWSASHADVETAIPCEQNIMSEFWAKYTTVTNSRDSMLKYPPSTLKKDWNVWVNVFFLFKQTFGCVTGKILKLLCVHELFDYSSKSHLLC